MSVTDPNRPVLVVVGNGRYDVFALDSNPTPRDLWLFGLIQGMGGINESVEEGRHHFNATLVDENTTVVTLDKIEE